jgi:hypothetical protein
MASTRSQYATYLATLGAFAAVGYLGFQATGGALPYGKKFHAVVDGAVATGGDSLVQFGRAPGDSVFGVVLAGPIRRGGLVAEFLVIVAVLALAGVGFYWYATRGDAPTR